jgi:hypothetical protein
MLEPPYVGCYDQPENLQVRARHLLAPIPRRTCYEIEIHHRMVNLIEVEETAERNRPACDEARLNLWRDR